MKRFIAISAVLTTLVTLSLFCTSVEFDNVLDPVSPHYVGDSAAADDDGNDTANYFEPDHPLFGDKTPPVVILVPSDNPASIKVRDQAALDRLLRGFKATDDMDEDINERVTPTSDVNILEPGNYTITYTATDRAGNTISVTRKVIVVPVDVVDTIPPNISLVSAEEITLLVGQEYTEYGATATDWPDGDLSKKIEISGTVNTNVPGTYKITYTVKDNAGLTASVTRTVIVEPDDGGPNLIAPTVTLNGSKDTLFAIGGTYVEFGATAEDNEGPVDVSIQRLPNFPDQPDYPGEYRIIYTASNAVGSGTATRTLVVMGDCLDDYTPPDITLIGGSEVDHPLGAEWVDPGWTAMDDIDGSNAIKLPVEGSVDVNTEGTYILTYKALDLCNNEGTATRTVNVVGTTAETPVITILGDNPETITVGTPYVDAGATAVPDVPVTIKTNTVDESTPGEYIVEYTATNEGVEGTATRTVIVVSGGTGGDGELLSKYQVPRSTGLGGFNVSFSDVTTEGEGGPSLGGRTLTLNFDQWGFHQFSIDSPWDDLKSSVTHTLTQPNPTMTITASGIPNLDGEYYANYIDGNFILVATDGSYAIVCKP